MGNGERYRKSAFPLPIRNSPFAHIHPRPPASFAAAGERISIIIAPIPTAGPSASTVNDHRPKIDSAAGISRMVAIVSRNPRLVCSASAVPMYSGRAEPRTYAECRWAELEEALGLPHSAPQGRILRRLIDAGDSAVVG
jgi:hypothetical protein